MDGGPTAKLVVDTAGGDEFFVEARQGGGLDVVEFELPADDVAD